MAWKDQHPNWRQKAAALGWGADRIARIAAGGDPGPAALAEYNALKGTNALQPAAPAAAPGAPAFNESAFDIFNKLMAQMGIPAGGDITAIIRQAVVDGYTPNQIGLIIPDLQNTASWNLRFPGWKTRVANGFSQLEVGQYLALENQYHTILRSAGLPAGFYDDPSDFGDWIAKNISPDEIQSRVSNAVGLANQVDPTARSLLTSFYGVTTGDLAAYFLDSNRALPTLDRQYKAVNVAAWAKRSGLNVAGPGRYEDLVDKGVTEQQAAQSYATIAQFTRTFGALGQIHGLGFSQDDAENDVFFNDNEKRQKLISRESAMFSGQAGTRGGQSASTAGSY